MNQKTAEDTLNANRQLYFACIQNVNNINLIYLIMLQLPPNVSNPHCPYLINLWGKLVDQLKPLNYYHINISPT